MGAVGVDDHADALRRSLVWDGCFNVRDLGGLETASGGRTRRGMVVRADNVRRLTAAGWQAALDHGVRRVVDLRFENEVPGEPDAHGEVEVVVVPLRERSRSGGGPGVRAGAARRRRPRAGFRVELHRHCSRSTASGSVALSRRSPIRRPVRASSSTALRGRIAPGSCRRLLLSLVGVPDELIADDYAASDPGVEVLSAPWFAAARDEPELELRRRVSTRRTRRCSTCSRGSRQAGGAEQYLLAAGVTDAQLRLLRARLVG